MNTFLITGGAGFIGSHLVERLLQQNNTVIVIDNFDDFYSYKIKLQNLSFATKIEHFNFTHEKDKDINNFVQKANNDSVQIVYGDIRDANLLDQIFISYKIDCIVHLAALAGVRPSIENPIAYESVNVQGSMRLFEMCKKHKVHKFICASSSSVYGNNDTVPFTETDVVDFAISPYAATKKSVEVIGHVYHQLNAIDMIQLRFFTVYGPRQRPDLAIHKFTKLIMNDEPIPFYGDGSTARDYTYIDDIIEGIENSIKYLKQHSAVYEILNLGESEVITLNEMVDTLGRALNKHVERIYLPMQAGDVNRTYANINKAKTMIGYNPKTKFEDGITKFVQWMQNK